MRLRLQQYRAPRATILMTVLVLMLSASTTASKRRRRDSKNARSNGEIIKSPKSATKPSPSATDSTLTTPILKIPSPYPTPINPTPTPPPNSTPTPPIILHPKPSPAPDPAADRTNSQTIPSPTPNSFPPYHSSKTPAINSVDVRSLQPIQITFSLTNQINKIKMEQSTENYITTFTNTYWDESVSRPLYVDVSVTEQQQRERHNMLRRRRILLRSGIISSSSSGSDNSSGVSSIETSRQWRYTQERKSLVVRISGSLMFVNTEAPSDEQLNNLYFNAFIKSEGKALYKAALVEDEVVIGQFDMEVEIVNEENGQIMAKQPIEMGKQNHFNVWIMAAGALLAFLIAGFGCYRWRRRRQLYQKQGTKCVMLSDHIPDSIDDGKNFAGQTVWDGTSDGTARGASSLTPSTLASCRSYRSSGGNYYDDYSLDGSNAIGSSPNAGEKFLEGVVNMSEYPVHSTVEEASRGSSADNHDSTSVFSFSNQYIDSASVTESVLGGLSAASSYFTGDKTKYSVCKALTGFDPSDTSRALPPADDGNDEKYEDGIEVLLGGNILESNANPDLFDELYSPSPTEEEKSSGTRCGIIDTLLGDDDGNVGDGNGDGDGDGDDNNDDDNVKKALTPTQESPLKRTSNALIEEDDEGNVEKILTPAQKVPPERNSNSIDQQPDIRTPSPERDSQEGSNLNDVRSKKRHNLKNMPSTKQARSKLKNSTEQQIHSLVRQISPARKEEILADLQQDDPMCPREENTQSSLHKISVATRSATQLNSNYPIQTKMLNNYSYSDTTDDDSASYEGSSSDDSSYAPSKPLENVTGGTELAVIANDDRPLSPASKRKLLSGKNISRERMSARIRASSPLNSDNGRFHSIRPLKDGVSSTNHAANVRRNRLASTLRARSADKNTLNQGEEEISPASNIGKNLRKKRLQQQKITGSFRKVRVQQENSEQTKIAENIRKVRIQQGDSERQKIMKSFRKVREQQGDSGTFTC